MFDSFAHLLKFNKAFLIVESVEMLLPLSIFALARLWLLPKLRSQDSREQLKAAKELECCAQLIAILYFIAAAITYGMQGPSFPGTTEGFVIVLLLVLLPVLLGILGILAMFFWMKRTCRHLLPTMDKASLPQWRTNFIVVLGVSAYLAAYWASQKYFHSITPFYALLALSILLLNVFYASFLRRTCRLEKIENGPIRNHFDELVQKAGVHCKHLWLIRTEVKMSNALVNGIIPQFRGVYLTEDLVEKFPANEIRAILAHEIAHIKKGHLFIVAGISFVWIAISWYLEISNGSQLVDGLNLLYWCICVPWASRQMEYSADAFAAHLTSKQEMTNALQRLAQVNLLELDTAEGDDVQQTHPSFKKRIEALEQLKTAE